MRTLKITTQVWVGEYDEAEFTPGHTTELVPGTHDLLVTETIELGERTSIEVTAGV